MNLQEIAETTSGESVLGSRVERALRASGYPPLRNLRVRATRSSVRIEGSVSTYHLKQLAQATALAVPGVRRLLNEVEVIAMR